MEDLGEGVGGGDRLAEEGAEVFAGNAVELGHEQQSLRADEIRRRIAPAVPAAVRAAHVLEHSATGTSNVVSVEFNSFEFNWLLSNAFELIQFNWFAFADIIISLNDINLFELNWNDSFGFD